MGGCYGNAVGMCGFVCMSFGSTWMHGMILEMHACICMLVHLLCAHHSSYIHQPMSLALPHPLTSAMLSNNLHMCLTPPVWFLRACRC
jgi:hypothetical protein